LECLWIRCTQRLQNRQSLSKKSIFLVLNIVEELNKVNLEVSLPLRIF
jgi:hypothetical protein